MMTPSLPPYLGCFASMSPKVRETESLPGMTRCGPKMYYYCIFPSSAPGTCTFYIDCV